MWSNQNITITNATLRSMAKANENRHRENLTEKNEFLAHILKFTHMNQTVEWSNKWWEENKNTEQRCVMYFNYTLELWRNGSPRFIDTWRWWTNCCILAFLGSFSPCGHECNRCFYCGCCCKSPLCPSNWTLFIWFDSFMELNSVVVAFGISFLLLYSKLLLLMQQWKLKLWIFEAQTKNTIH